MAADPDIQKRKRLEGEEYKNSELPQEDELPTLPKHHLGEQLAREFGRVDTVTTDKPPASSTGATTV